jgi:hypothetical protein
LFQDLLWDASSGIPNRQTDDFGIDLYLNLYSWASGIAVYVREAFLKDAEKRQFHGPRKSIHFLRKF